MHYCKLNYHRTKPLNRTSSQNFKCTEQIATQIQVVPRVISHVQATNTSSTFSGESYARQAKLVHSVAFDHEICLLLAYEGIIIDTFVFRIFIDSGGLVEFVPLSHECVHQIAGQAIVAGIQLLNGCFQYLDASLRLLYLTSASIVVPSQLLDLVLSCLFRAVSSDDGVVSGNDRTQSRVTI